MAKRIHLIRHGQAEHVRISRFFFILFNEPRLQNVHNVETIPDPHLTPLGVEQARSLTSIFPKFKSLNSSTSLIVSSPFRRTLETTLLGFKDVLKSGAPLIILPQVMWIFTIFVQHGNANFFGPGEFPQSYKNVDRHRVIQEARGKPYRKSFQCWIFRSLWKVGIPTKVSTVPVRTNVLHGLSG
jgi:Histidine phosphatase superfamily (branch 1)